MSDNEARFDEIVEVAPAEISAEVEAVIPLVRQLDEALARADFDGARLDRAALQSVFDGLDEQFPAVDAWNQANCP